MDCFKSRQDAFDQWWMTGAYVKPSYSGECTLAEAAFLAGIEWAKKQILVQQILVDKPGLRGSRMYGKHEIEVQDCDDGQIIILIKDLK